MGVTGSIQDRYETNLTANDTNNIIHMQNIVPLGNFESLRQSFKTNKSKMSELVEHSLASVPKMD